VLVELDALDAASPDVRDVAVNALDLAIHSATILVREAEDEGRGPARTRAARWTVEPQRQTVTFAWDEPLPRSRALALEVVFSGRLNEQLAGFYKSTVAPGRVMAVTQFEATDARRALPCWDEPARKATFRLTLATDPKYTVLSNTRPAAVEHRVGALPSGAARDEKRWTFHKTPRMSTYLLAFVVTDHVVDALSETSPRTGIETVVYVPRGKADKAGFALDCAVRALDFYSGLFEVPYPIKVMQHVAIPDFCSRVLASARPLPPPAPRPTGRLTTTATQPRVRWRTSHASRTARPGCSWTRRRRRPQSGTWRAWCATSCRTSGSAT